MGISTIDRRMRKVPIRLRYRDGSKVLAVLPLPYTQAELPLVIACGRTLFRHAGGQRYSGTDKAKPVDYDEESQ